MNKELALHLCTKANSIRQLWWNSHAAADVFNKRRREGNRPNNPICSLWLWPGGPIHLSFYTLNIPVIGTAIVNQVIHNETHFSSAAEQSLLKCFFRLELIDIAEEICTELCIWVKGHGASLLLVVSSVKHMSTSDEISTDLQGASRWNMFAST